MDSVRVCESDFVFGRVNVDIDHEWVHLDEENDHGLLVGFDEAAVGFFHGVDDSAVADGSAVDVDVLMFDGGFGDGG